MKPLIILAITGILSLYAGLFHKRMWLLPISTAGLVLALIFTLLDWNTATLYYNMARMDNFALAFNATNIFCTLLILLLSTYYFSEVEQHVAEIHSLFAFTLVGTFMMTSFTNFTTLFIGIETMSIPLYVLAGSKKQSISSNEASFKYFLLGSFASAIFLLGVALIYGTTVSFDLQQIANFISVNHAHLPKLFYAGVMMVIIGLAFKIAAVPFHFWIPDVYQGAPTLITAFMATVIKTAGAAAFYKILSTTFIDLNGFWYHALWAIAFLTLILSNLIAVQQDRVKRILAYSSISHTGFLVMAMVAMNSLSANSIWFYTLSYSLSTITTFAILIIVKKSHHGDGSIDSFNGLAKTNPFLAFMMAVSLLSLAGIPITSGFFAKYFIFMAAMKSQLIVLTIMGILAALIGVYYYLKIIYAMYIKEADHPEIIPDWRYKISLSICVGLTLALGIYPLIDIL
jgi:NADH-quinone oxidoreductase subunit N